MFSIYISRIPGIPGIPEGDMDMDMDMDTTLLYNKQSFIV
jgi:hypothetical protein